MLNSLAKMAQISNKADLLSCGVDAYTAVFRGSSRVDKAMELVQLLEFKLNIANVPKSLYANHGYNGVNYGLFFYGVKGQNVIIGSAGAGSVEVEEICRPYFPEVTRIDFQVTVNLPFADEELIPQIYKEQLKLAKVKKRWPDAKLVSSVGGETLYVGKRGSGTMLRLYDKGSDYQIDPGLILRFEIEYRDEIATNMAHALARVASIDDQILRQVFHGFYQRGIRLPLEYGEWPDSLSVPSNGASHQAYLDWARRVIGPTMKKLQGFNEGQELLRELGIQTSFLDNEDSQKSED